MHIHDKWAEKSESYNRKKKLFFILLSYKNFIKIVILKNLVFLGFWNALQILLFLMSPI